VLALGLSSSGQARSLEDQIWVWWQQTGVTNSQIERKDGGVQNIGLFAVATCADGSTLTVGAGVYDGGPIDANGNFSYSGPDPDDPGTQIELHGHFGATTLSGTFRLSGLASYCGEHAPGDTGLLSFTATCYDGNCPSGGGGGGGGGSTLVVPSGNWKVSYPPKFKCGSRTCSSGYYDGPPRLKAALQGMLLARLALTPRCAAKTCSVDANVTTRSGKRFKVTVRPQRSSFGTHSVATVRPTSVSCAGRRLKVKVIFGLTQVGTGASAKLTVKERIFVANPSDHPLRCAPIFANADLGYRHTSATPLP
jgi:hypothetical protein